MVVYFVRPEDWIPGLSAVPLAKITGIFILLAVAFSFQNIHWHMPREVVFLFLLVVQLWLAAVFSPVWKGGAFNVMFDYTKVLPLVIVVYAAVHSMKRLRGILFVQSGSVAALAIISIAGRHKTGGRLEGDISTMFGNSNDLALVIDLTLPLCLALALTTRSYWKRVVWIVIMTAMIYAVFLTASRGGAVALCVATIVCLWQLGIKGQRFYLLLLVPCAVIALWLYGGDALRERFEHTSIDPVTGNRGTEATGSAQQRKELLFQSLRETGRHPLFGVGPGNFEVVSGNWHVTHNSYTQMSSEGGIPAFVLYLLIFWRALVNLRKVRKYGKSGKGIGLFSMALEASLAAYLVGSFFLSLAYHLFPYLLVADTGALLLIVKADRPTSSGVSEPELTPAVEVTVW